MFQGSNYLTKIYSLIISSATPCHLVGELFFFMKELIPFFQDYKKISVVGLTLELVPLLNVPSVADVLHYDGKSVVICTSAEFFFYFPDEDLEVWSYLIEHSLKEKEAHLGYYLVNHLNGMVRFISNDWDTFCKKLDGKYPSLDWVHCVTESPKTFSDIRKTIERRKKITPVYYIFPQN